MIKLPSRYRFEELFRQPPELQSRGALTGMSVWRVNHVRLKYCSGLALWLFVYLMVISSTMATALRDLESATINENVTTVPASRIVPPTTMHSRPKIHWQVSNSNRTCVLLEASSIEFVFFDPYIEFPITTNTGQLDQQFGPPLVFGSCTTSRVWLFVVWQFALTPSQFNLTMEFVYHPNAGTWDAARFSHTFNHQTTFHYSGEGYFRSPYQSAYYCHNRSTSSLLGNARTSFIDIRVEAFPIRNTFSKGLVQCPDSKPKSTSSTELNFVVGVSVGSVVLVAVVAFIIARCAKRSQYESINSSDF